MPTSHGVKKNIFYILYRSTYALNIIPKLGWSNTHSTIFISHVYTVLATFCLWWSVVVLLSHFKGCCLLLRFFYSTSRICTYSPETPGSCQTRHIEDMKIEDINPKFTHRLGIWNSSGKRALGSTSSNLIKYWEIIQQIRVQCSNR
jgi:hypothetical protein